MKKIIFASLAVICAFASCQNLEISVDTPEAVKHTVHFIAEAPQTKTSLSISGTEVTYSWSADDTTRISIYEGNKKADEVHAVLDGNNMNITAVFEGAGLATSTYKAVFNAGVKAVQTAVGTGYDQESDVLVSNEITGPGTFTFSRKNAFVRMTLKNIGGSKLDSIKVVSDKMIACSFNTKGTGEFDADTSKIIRITTVENTIKNDSTVLFFPIVPITDATLKVVAYTSDSIYVKYLTKTVSIDANNVKGMKVNMDGCDVVFYESFDKCTGLGGNDNQWNGSIASETLNDSRCDVTGWNFSNGNGANGCVKLGTSKKKGSATSPQIALNDSATLKFKAGAWDNSSENIMLNLTATNATISPSSVSLTKGAFSDFEASITEVTGNVTITFEAYIAEKNRFFLDEVRVINSAETKYYVTCSPEEGGEISATPNSALSGGETITLAATPSEGYEFGGWTVVDSDSNPVSVADNTFTMPNKDVTVSATFNKKSYNIDKITPSNGTYTVTVGGVEVSSVTYGDSVTLAATPADGYIFSSWTVTNKTKSTSVYVNPNNKFKMPASDVSVIAAFIALASIPTYASLAELVADGDPTSTDTKVNVTFSNETIKSVKTNEVTFAVTGHDVTVYCTATHPTWEVGGWVSGTLSACDWVMYKDTIRELKPATWEGLSYKAPVATPVITITSGSATITCATVGATIRYTTDGTQPTEGSTEYTSPVSLTNGQTIIAKAFKTGCPPSSQASEIYTAGSVIYTVSSTSAVTRTGTAPSGSTATYSSTYSSKCQLTKGNSMTLTLSGFSGKTITGIKLSMKSNKSSGAGTLSAMVGETSIAGISSGTNFNEWYDNTSYSTDYKDINVTLTNTTKVVGESENIVITIAATANSLYCQSFEISYK